MTITLTPDIENALTEQAREQGTTPETLALDGLREKFVPDKAQNNPVLIEPRDDWERLLASAGTYTGEPTDDLKPRDAWEALVLGIGVETGVALTDEQVSREIIYEDHD